MKSKKKIPTILSLFTKQFIILIIASTLFLGCAVTKTLTATFDLLDTQNVTSIKQGMTRNEVINIIGKPEGKDKKNNYDYYLYINIYAKKDNIFGQELHIYYNDNDIVEKTIYVIITKGGDENNTSTLLECFSSLEIGKSTFDQVKNSLYPTVYMDYYQNGDLNFKILGYSTNFSMYMPLKNLPFVGYTMNDDRTVDYYLTFNDKGILATQEHSIDDLFIKFSE